MNLRASFTLLFTLALAGCFPKVVVDGEDSSASAGGAGGGSGSSSGGGGGALCAGFSLPASACTPADPSCHSATAACLPVHENAGATSFGLRMADFEITAPLPFTKGLVGTVITTAITPSNAACNLNGGGTFSWLLAFDSAAGTLTTGGARPAPNPALGYSFVNEDAPILGGKLPLAPVTLTAPLGAGCTTTSSSAADLNLPVYLDMMAASAILLPLRQVRFVDVTISGDHTCIGKFNALGLDPASGCLPDASNPIFARAGQVDSFINLDQADAIPVAPIGQTLCLLLTGDAATFGDGGAPMARCKRSNGKIVFQGDWCSATNQPATPDCSDAVRFSGAFAASGVIIK